MKVFSKTHLGIGISQECGDASPDPVANAPHRTPMASDRLEAGVLVRRGRPRPRPNLLHARKVLLRHEADPVEVQLADVLVLGHVELLRGGPRDAVILLAALEGPPCREDKISLQRLLLVLAGE